MMSARRLFSRKHLLLVAVLLGSAVLSYGQSAYQIVRSARKLTVKPVTEHISRHLRAPIANATLAKQVANLKNPASLQVFSDYRIFQNKKGKVYIPQINIVSEFDVPPLKDPSSLWGSYRYLRVLTSLSRENLIIDPQYKAMWRRVFNVEEYCGVHHIVNKSTLKDIYFQMKQKAAAKHEVVSFRLDDMQKDAPGSLHPFHGNKQFSSVFHNQARQLKLYEQGGVKLIILDYFKNLQRLAREYPGVAPKISEEVIKNTLLEAKLWSKTFNLRWQ